MDRGRILADGPKEEILKRLQTGEFKRSIDADQEKQDDKKPQDGDQK
jgi:ABC-type multidrug transport system ATPase subunit